MADRKKIAIDIDDVLADTTEAIRLWGNAKTGVELTKEHFNTVGEYWGYYERVWLENGVADVLIYDDVEKAIAEDEVMVPLLAGASFAIKELTKTYDIILITSRDPILEPTTRRWLAKHFSDEKIELYFSNNHRRQANMDITKGELCRQFGVSLLIDDNVAHCQSALDAGLEAILFGNYGWQQDIPKELGRCKDWPAVLETINGRL